MQYVNDLSEFLVMFAPFALAGAGVGLAALVIIAVWTVFIDLFPNE